MNLLELNQNSRERNHTLISKEKFRSNNKKIGLIESIPKLNLKDILNSENKAKLIYKPRNKEAMMDKSLHMVSINNNSAKSNLDMDDDKKYDTDVNFPLKCHNNIFDFYDIDKFDTYNTTLLEAKNISSSSNQKMNQNHSINKVIRKKKIVNLKAFLNNKMIHPNKKYSLNKLISILNNIYKKYFFKKLYDFKEYNTLSIINKDDEMKLKNLEEKILKSNNINKNNNSNEKSEIFASKIKSIDNNKESYNIIGFNNIYDLDSNSEGNYFNYMEQLSSRYKKEREQELNTIIKYRPTNISFVLNNFPNNKIFNEIQKEFNLIKKEFKSKENVRNQLNFYKKYYGDIEAINEEDNESDDIKKRKSSRRNKDNSSNKSIEDFNHSVSFSKEDNLDFPINKLLDNMKSNNNTKIIKKPKSSIYVIKSPNKDNSKFNLDISKNCLHKICEIDNIEIHQAKMKSFSIDSKNRDNKISIKKYNYSNQSNNYNNNFDENNCNTSNSQFNETSKQVSFSIILLFLFIYAFFSKNFRLSIR